MNNIELKLKCMVVEDFPLPPGRPASRKIVPVDQDISFCITKNQLQVYFKDGMFGMDRSVAVKLLELLANHP